MRIPAATIGLFVCSAATMALAQSTSYTIAVLSGPAGTGFDPPELSDNEQVIGIAGGVGSILIDQRGNFTQLQPGAPFQPFASSAFINNNGSLLAGNGSISGGSGHAFTLTMSGATTDLGTLGGDRGDTSTARSVNNLGQVVGGSTVNAGSGGSCPTTCPGVFTHPFIYSNGVMTDLGVGQGNAYAVNDKGDVAGAILT